MSCFNWNIFLRWEMFLFSILTFWVFEMRKPFNVIRCIPPFLFFLKLTLCTTQELFGVLLPILCIFSFFFFFLLLDRPGSLILMNEPRLNLWMRGSLVTKMKASWVVVFSSVEALSKYILLHGSDCSDFIHDPGPLFIEAIPLKSVTSLVCFLILWRGTLPVHSKAEVKSLLEYAGRLAL